MSLRSDFPIFVNDPSLVFLDSASTAQKPQIVIDRMKYLLEHDYANIHRGAYRLSEASESIYSASKEAVRGLVNAREVAEINYTGSATYAFNFLSLSLVRSGMLKKGDKILLSLAEHHANVVPWMIASEMVGFSIDFITLDTNGDLDFSDFKAKLTQDVRLVSLTAASNVTGTVTNLERARDLIRSRENVLFAVDGSQGVPHFRIDVQSLDIDFLTFTGHKIMTDTGFGVWYGKKELLKAMTPGLGGGGAINWVRRDGFAHAGLPYRYEPGTPHIVGAASMLAACEYIDSIGGYDQIEVIEQDLVTYTLDQLTHFDTKFPGKIELLGSRDAVKRIGVFSFAIDEVHPTDIAEVMADANICVRSGYHCAEPLADSLQNKGSVRMSLYLYNTHADIDRFFEVLEEIIISNN